VLSWPKVTGAIVGASTPAHVEGWLPAADITLTDGELDLIATAINETGAGSGPPRPPPAKDNQKLIRATPA